MNWKLNVTWLLTRTLNWPLSKFFYEASASWSENDFPRGLSVYRDGRLHEGDQILAIDGQPLDSNISHQQAISILQKAQGLVELVVARSEDVVAHPISPSPSPSPSAVSDTSKAGSDMVVSSECLIHTLDIFMRVCIWYLAMSLCSTKSIRVSSWILNGLKWKL